MQRMIDRMRGLFGILLPLALCLQGLPASAHGVVVWAEVVEDEVWVEAFLTDGHSVAQARVRVIDREGRLLLEGRLDEQGKFAFPLPRTDELLIRVSLDKGHAGEYTLRPE